MKSTDLSEDRSMHSYASRIGRVLVVASAALLTACATGPDPLYYWGDYQSQVYGHLTGQKGPTEQITRLEAGIEKARSAGKPLPPGYFAHLAILHAEQDDTAQMLNYFDAEKQAYPESAAYIDFLLSSKTERTDQQLTQQQ
jgi:hypothetical protein